MECNIATSAVLALHWTHDIVHEDGAFGPMFASMVARTGAISNTRSLIEAARANGVPVIYTRVAFRLGHPDLVVNGPLYGAIEQTKCLVDGERGSQIIDELAPQPGEPVVINRRVGGFTGSDLDALLRARGVETVILTGVATHLTVLATALAASDLGYRVMVLSDCTASDSEEHHAQALGLLGPLAEVVASTDVIKALSD